MRTAAQRRGAVRDVMIAAGVSERRACRFTGVARSTQRFRPARNDDELRARLETLAILKPRWGYRRLHGLLEREGTHVNRKRGPARVSRRGPTRASPTTEAREHRARAHDRARTAE